MATINEGGPVKRHPALTTAVLSVVGYALVIGTFVGLVPHSVFPHLSLPEVNAVTDAIGVVNTVTTVLLVLGWYWIRRGKVRRHRAAMSSSFVLIMVFLVLYLAKIGGGGTKEIVGAPPLVTYLYLGMLAVHILLSVVAVPVVVYALVLGLTHTPEELRTQTPHKRVGRIAAASWIVSLSLGVVTYVILNHLYSWKFVRGTAAAVTLSLV